MKVHLITVGDELLIGQVVNTNASWMGEQLIVRGAEVVRMVTVPDELDIIVEELRHAAQDADLIIMTGGLGPTHDDLTRESIASFLGVKLELNEEVVSAIQARFRHRDREMPARNKMQAMVPAGCEVLHNPVGTAPGLWYAGPGYNLCALPGVPHEMKELMALYVFPRIVKDKSIRPLAQRTLLTIGIGESTLQERLGDAGDWLGPQQKLAYLPQIGGVRLRLMAYSDTWEDAIHQVASMEAIVRQRIENDIYGADDEVIERRIGQLLVASNLTLASAESCTGGLISDRITNISGASSYFKGGIIAYSNDVKHRILGVQDDVVEEYGAVSEPVAMQMAEGARHVLGADIGISATGIMGPSGGSAEKPVGTVWIGYADSRGVKASCVLTQKDRKMNKLYASSFALNILWRALNKSVVVLLIALVCAACGTTGNTQRPAQQDQNMKDQEVPIYEAALGSFERQVSTTSEMAQAYMNQGFQMMYSFASDEAPATFRAAQKHDEGCAMCSWGEAWSLGPYLNGGMKAENAPAAFKAIHTAQALAVQNATSVEKALIEAMIIRYAETHDDLERKRRDTLYANAMGDAYKLYPEDKDIGTLYAESLMLLEPRRGRWDIDDPDVRAIHRILEEVLALDIRHPGACHLYIHATESTTSPGKAEACAAYLGNSIPGASHINHMPSHTYNRIGRWGDAVRANIQAWHSDQKADINEGFAIYPSHNLHMLLFAASMDGQGALAMQAAKDYGKIIDGGNFYEGLALLRFGRFDEIIALEGPPDPGIFRGLWDFSKGYAYLRMGQTKKAQAYLTRVEKAASESSKNNTFRGHSAAELLGVAGGILKGEILLGQGDAAQAIDAFKKAIELEDSLRYDEPEPLNFSARHWLGAAYLDLNRPAEAEAVYKAALEDHPNNGWSLLGLAQSLEAQDKTNEAKQTRAAFEKAWIRADTWIRASRF